MPASSALADEKLNINFEGSLISYHFEKEDLLSWEVLAGPEKGLKGTNSYKAFEVRPSIFFIDFYKIELEEHVGLVVNYHTGQAIAGHSRLDDTTNQRRTKTQFIQGNIDTLLKAPPYPETDELVGQHIVYRYSPRDAYEHLYLNRGTLTWHCLAGTEKGLADTELSRVFKLDEHLYLLFWTENIMPVESFVVVDLARMRSTGRFFCWDPKPRKIVHMVFGSYATRLARTDAAAVLEARLTYEVQGGIA